MEYIKKMSGACILLSLVSITQSAIISSGLKGVTLTPKSVYSGGLLQQVSLLQVGGLTDYSFNGGSLIVPDFGGTIDQDCRAGMLQADGKIVLVGSANPVGGGLCCVAARCFADGTMDSSFGDAGNGTIVIPLFGDGNNDEARAGQLQQDGKIVMAGVSYDGGGNYFSAVRLTTAGLPDVTFGDSGNGTVTLVNFDGASTQSEAHALQIQLDGKLVLAGTSFDGANFCFSVACLNQNGTPYNAFGPAGNGTYLLPYVGILGNNSVNALQIQSDGKLLLAGISCNDFNNPTNSRYLIARLMSNGSLDTTFGQGGFLQLPLLGASTSDQCNAVLVQPDGKILMCGSSTIGGETRFSIVRLLSTGAVDSAFGTNGYVIVEPFAGGAANVATCLFIQQDGKIVVGGYANYVFHGETTCSLVRLTSNGQFDSTFGPSGNGLSKLFTNGDDVNRAFSILMLSDQKFILTGNAVLAGHTHFFVARATNQYPLTTYQAEYPGQGGFY